MSFDFAQNGWLTVYNDLTDMATDETVYKEITCDQAFFFFFFRERAWSQANEENSARRIRKVTGY